MTLNFSDKVLPCKSSLSLLKDEKKRNSIIPIIAITIVQTIYQSCPLVVILFDVLRTGAVVHLWNTNLSANTNDKYKEKV